MTRDRRVIEAMSSPSDEFSSRTRSAVTHMEWTYRRAVGAPRRHRSARNNHGAGTPAFPSWPLAGWFNKAMPTHLHRIPRTKRRIKNFPDLLAAIIPPRLASDPWQARIAGEYHGSSSRNESVKGTHPRAMMASITRRSPDIPGTDAHPNISGAC